MGFLNPIAFALAIFVAGLVVLYLWERNQRRFDVPSLLLWQEVSESVVRRSRFQPDTLFWFQLATLLALILGLANPYWQSDDDPSPMRTILVIDLSASMQAREGERTRLALAREAAASVVKAAAGEQMLIHAGRRPSTAISFTDDPLQILHALNDLTTEDTAARLEPALAIAQRIASHSEVATEIHVFTDQPRQRVDPRWQAQAHWWPVGSADDNLAISGLHVAQGVLQGPDSASARVEVRNYGAGKRHASLRVDLAGTTVARRLFTIGPTTTSVHHFAELGAPGLLRVSLDSEDVLPLDNQALGWVRPWHPLRIGWVGEADSALAEQLQHIAAATGSIEIHPLAANAPKFADLDLAIFYRTKPGREVSKATLEIMSRGVQQQGGFAVLQWNDAHPLLRGIQPDSIQDLPAVAIGSAPEWAEPVLETRVDGKTVAVLQVGRPGPRRALLNIDPGAIGLLSTDHEALLLLLFNLFDWLGSDARNVLTTQTGDSIPLSPSADRRITDPRGETTALAADTTALALPYAGTYRLADGTAEQTVLANFRDAGESDVGRPRPAASVPSAAASDTTRKPPSDGYGAWLYLIATVLLLAEWIAALKFA